MTIHDLRRPRSPHPVTFREVWTEDFTFREKLMVIPAVVAVLIVIVAVLAVMLGGTW